MSAFEQAQEEAMPTPQEPTAPTTSQEVCRGRVSFLYLTGWRDRECGKVGCVEHGFNKSKVQSPTTKPPSSESGMDQ